MKFVAIVLVMALVSCQALAYGGDHMDHEVYERAAYKPGKLEKFLVSLQELMRSGNTSLGIPILEPYTSVQQTVALKEEEIDVKAVLTNIRADGLSNYNVLKGEFSMIGVKANVRLFWPAIIYRSGYIVKGSAYGLTLHGHGDASAVVKDLDVAVNLKFSVRGGHLYVKNIDSAVHLGSLDFKVTGLLGDEEISVLLSSIISDITPQIIDDYQELVTERLNTVVSGVLNEFLSDMSLSDLLGMIG